MKKELKLIADNLEIFLVSNYKNLFSYRNFYWILFTALSVDDKEVKNILINYYTTIEKTKDFHREFNNYALLELNNTIESKQIDELIKKLQFRNNYVLNWKLLKYLCLLKKNWTKKTIVNKIIRLVKNHEDEWLLKDNFDQLSFQYHCYSLALLYEIIEITNNKELLWYFTSWVEFIVNFILPNWQSLYLWRWQEQIFWYWTLLYSLEKYRLLKRTKLDDQIIMSHQYSIITYISKFTRKDWSIPLVLRKEEIIIPNIPNINSKDTLGWYSYNNAYDF